MNVDGGSEEVRIYRMYSKGSCEFVRSCPSLISPDEGSHGWPVSCVPGDEIHWYGTMPGWWMIRVLLCSRRKIKLSCRRKVVGSPDHGTPSSFVGAQVERLDEKLGSPLFVASRIALVPRTFGMDRFRRRLATNGLSSDGLGL